MENTLKFEFGKNWKNFSKKINNEKIKFAKNSLKRLLLLDDLKNKTFFDIGCGSGLMSLAATQMGAKILAVDSDAKAVETTKLVLRAKSKKNSKWLVKYESILNENYLKTLNKFDVVYAWGVLHHTGKMWKAIDLASQKVKENGLFAISIYNDQGGASKRWKIVKKIYVLSPKIIRLILIFFFFLFFEIRSFLIKTFRFQNYFTFKDWKNKNQDRGMSYFTDLTDWIGGYPFEYAKPEEIFNFLKKRGFVLLNLKTCAGGHGCNEFLFKKLMKIKEKNN